MRTLILFLRISSFVLLFFCSFLLAGCYRDLDSVDRPKFTDRVNDLEMVTGGVNGIVVDENNNPVAGATVISGTTTTTTDGYGAFRFRDISLSKSNGTVKVTRSGYFTAYRSFVSVEGRINNVRIKLLPKTNSGSLDAGAGGIINITGGGKLVIPANAVVNATGTTYTGLVNIAMTWIDPSSPDLPSVLMGDLRGIAANGEERGLSTYGMIGVELTSAGGQPLKLASGKTAELSFPIPASLQASAPATIDLWHFDETTARWRQEGTAVRSGNTYIANVSHFSFWNCDAPFPLVDLCMSFNDNNNAPLINALVRIKKLSDNTSGYGRTDSTGNLCGKVPKNEPLLLELLAPCGSAFFSQNIGPFNSGTTLPPIAVSISTANYFTITGLLTNCSGLNVTQGSVTIYVAGGNQYVVPVINGQFDVNVLGCSGAPVNFAAIGFDYTAQRQSRYITGSGTTGMVNLGTISACGNLSDQYIQCIENGALWAMYMSPPDSIEFQNLTPTAPYTHRSFISCLNQSYQGRISINIPHNLNPGNYPGFCLLGPGSPISTPVVTFGGVNITYIDPFTSGYMEGNFIYGWVGPTGWRTINCAFRVRRN